MKFANKYELFEAVTSGRVETFFARDMASGERVLLHIFDAPEKKPDQPTVLWVLESFRKVAPDPPGLVLETGRYSGTTYAYLVTKLPDSAALKSWTQSYESHLKETAEITTPSGSPPSGNPATSKDPAPSPERLAIKSATAPSASPPGELTAALSGLVPQVNPPSEANTSKEAALGGIDFGSAETTPQREQGDFTKEFFSGSHEVPTLTNLAPVKSAGEAVAPPLSGPDTSKKTGPAEITLGPEQTTPQQAPGDFTRQFFSGSHDVSQRPDIQPPARSPEGVVPPDPSVPRIRTESRETVKAEAHESQSPKPSSSGGSVKGSSTPIEPQDSGGFTALFKSSFKSETQAPPERVGSSDNPADAKAGDFTDFFRGPFDGERPADTPDILPKAMEPPQQVAPGEFTRVFGSGRGSDLAPTPPLRGPVGDIPRREEPAAFTQIFSNTSQPTAPFPTNAPAQTWEPLPPKSEISLPSKEPAWTPPPQLAATPPVTPPIEPILPQPNAGSTAETPTPAGATHVFSVVRPPLSSPPPLPGGPGEYTRIISGGAESAPPSEKVPIAAPKIAVPAPPKFTPPAAPKAPELGKAFKPKPSYLPLVIILNVLLLVAILLIVYFEIKH